MPPKRGKTTRADAQEDEHIVQWLYRNDSADSNMAIGWTEYSLADSGALESGVREKKSRVNLSNGYVVDLSKMMQIRASDPSKRRPVKRFVGRLAVPSDVGVTTTKASRPERGPRVAVEVASASFPSPAGSATHLGRAPSAEPSPTLSLAHLVDAASSSSNLPHPSDASPVAFRRSTGGRFAIIGDDLLTGARAAGLGSPGSLRNPRYERMPWKSVAAIVSRVLREVPAIFKLALNDAAALMHGPTRKWLVAIGRPVDQKGMGITLPTPLHKLPKSLKVDVNTKATITAGDLAVTARKAIFSYFGEAVNDGSLIVNNLNLNEKQHLEALRMMISGPVDVLYDNEYQAMGHTPQVVVCSTPGINFSYSKYDLKAFATREGPDEPLVINKPVALAHMESVWAHVLTVMDGAHQVQFPVLCGIGCGAFRGKFGSQVPLLWATALHTVLSTRNFSHIHAVFISLPTFGTENNFDPFCTKIKKLAETHPLLVPLILVEDASMIATASLVSSWGYKSGVLNPSDVDAIRRGYIGMYWDGGHIALEEILAMQTTLLLHHVGVNPSLFEDADRRLMVDLRPPSA